MNKRFMRFPEGKKKSVTLSYDDCMEEDADLIELLEKYQMKATFNLIPGCPISLIVAFIYLFATGESLNVISLSSLSIAIGMVVDLSLIHI